MKKKTIAFDIDEVLTPLLQEIIKWHNNKYDTSYKLDDFYTYNYWLVWGGTKDETIKKVIAFCATDHFRNLKPMDGAAKVVRELADKHRLVIITSRRIELEDITRAWIERYFPNCFEEIYFGNHYALGGKSISKPDMCKRAGADVLVDDSPSYVKECAANGIDAYLFGEYPWNKMEETPGVYRASGWDDLLGRLNNHF